MERTERLYHMRQLLMTGRAITRREFMDDLEISRSTFTRDMEYLKDRLHAPIIYDRQKRGYVIDAASQSFELPGLWFNASEIYALMTMAQLLEELNPELLKPHIEPLQKQILDLLGSKDHPTKEVQKRIRMLPMASRQYNLKNFEILCIGLLSRKRLRITHYNRKRDDLTDRNISPQRMVYYRDNWYIDTWCHTRKDIRTFSVDTIEHAKLIKTRAKEVPDTKLNEHFQSGYGIFSGKSTNVGILRFTPERARWVAREQWHPNQKSKFDEKGYYILEIPYSDHRELIMNIMQYGQEVEVLGPDSLRKYIIDSYKEALEQYD